jgi:hypothetical protein
MAITKEIMFKRKKNPIFPPITGYQENPKKLGCPHRGSPGVQNLHNTPIINDVAEC